MSWPQRWLGNIYILLYRRFERGVFTFSEGLAETNVNEQKLSVAFSKLHRAGALIIFQRSRPRMYRLLDPRSFLFLGGSSRRFDFQDGIISQEEYVQLIYDVFRSVRTRIKLISFAVYGSVARRQATTTSDIDILLVSDGFRGSLASRIDWLGFVEEEGKEVDNEVKFLNSWRYRPFLSFYPLRKAEAERLPVLFLDLTEDAKIIYDEGKYLEETLSSLKARLQLEGARRIRAGNSTYWDLRGNTQER